MVSKKIEKLIKPKKKSKEILESRLKLLCEAFFLLDRNKYKIGNEEQFLKTNLDKDIERLVKERVNYFYLDKESYVVFRFFELIIGEREMFLDPEPNVIPLYDFCFLFRFNRYKENHELLEEIIKLGKMFSFSLNEIKDNLYLIDF